MPDTLTIHNQEVASAPLEGMQWPTFSESGQVIGADLAGNVDFGQLYQSTDPTEKGLIEVHSDNPNTFTAPTDPQEQELLKSEVISGLETRLALDRWWGGLAESLKRYGLNGEQARSASTIKSVYSVEFAQDGRPQGSVSIYECGEDPEGQMTASEQEALVDTLKIIDQFTGGAFLASEPSRRIITTLSRELIHPESTDSKPIGGLANEKYTLLNLAAIRDSAAEKGLPPETMLGLITTHEILGHQVERLGEGETGTFFKNHFSYSEEKVAGDKFNEVHAEIRPLDESASSSRPVREYGATNAAEDLATTSENIYLDTVDSSLIDRLGGHNRDAHREDLIMQLFDKVAHDTQEKDGVGYGYVGSPISYVEGKNGLTVQPARETAVHTMTPQEALYREFDEIASKYKGKPIGYKVVPRVDYG